MLPRLASMQQIVVVIGLVVVLVVSVVDGRIGCNDITSSGQCCDGQMACLTNSFENCAGEASCSVGCIFSHGETCQYCRWCSIGYCDDRDDSCVGSCLAVTSTSLCNRATSCTYCSTLGYCYTGSCASTCAQITSQSICNAASQCAWCTSLGGWCRVSSKSCASTCDAVTSHGSATCTSVPNCDWCSSSGGWCATSGSCVSTCVAISTPLGSAYCTAAPNCEWCSTLGGWCIDNGNCKTTCIDVTTLALTVCGYVPDCHWCTGMGGWCTTNPQVCVNDCKSMTPRGSLECVAPPECQWCTEHNGRCKSIDDLCLTSTETMSRTHSSSFSLSNEDSSCSISYSTTRGSWTLSPTRTDSPSSSVTESPTTSLSPTASASPSTTQSLSPELSESPSTTNSPTDTASPSASMTASPTDTLSPTVTLSPSNTHSLTPTESDGSPTVTSSPQFSTTPSESSSQTPTETNTPEWSTSASASVTGSPSSSASPSYSLSPSEELSPTTSNSTSRGSSSISPTNSSTPSWEVSLSRSVSDDPSLSKSGSEELSPTESITIGPLTISVHRDSQTKEPSSSRTRRTRSLSKSRSPSVSVDANSTSLSSIASLSSSASSALSDSASLSESPTLSGAATRTINTISPSHERSATQISPSLSYSLSSAPTASASPSPDGSVSARSRSVSLTNENTASMPSASPSASHVLSPSRQSQTASSSGPTKTQSSTGSSTLSVTNSRSEPSGTKSPSINRNPTPTRDVSFTRTASPPTSSSTSATISSDGASASSSASPSVPTYSNDITLSRTPSVTGTASKDGSASRSPSRPTPSITSEMSSSFTPAPPVTPTTSATLSAPSNTADGTATRSGSGTAQSATNDDPSATHSTSFGSESRDISTTWSVSVPRSSTQSGSSTLSDSPSNGAPTATESSSPSSSTSRSRPSVSRSHSPPTPSLSSQISVSESQTQTPLSFSQQLSKSVSRTPSRILTISRVSASASASKTTSSDRSLTMHSYTASGTPTEDRRSATSSLTHTQRTPSRTSDRPSASASFSCTHSMPSQTKSANASTPTSSVSPPAPSRTQSISEPSTASKSPPTNTRSGRSKTLVGSATASNDFSVSRPSWSHTEGTRTPSETRSARTQTRTDPSVSALDSLTKTRPTLTRTWHTQTMTSTAGRTPSRLRLSLTQTLSIPHSSSKSKTAPSNTHSRLLPSLTTSLFLSYSRRSPSRSGPTATPTFSASASGSASPTLLDAAAFPFVAVRPPFWTAGGAPVFTASADGTSVDVFLHPVSPDGTELPLSRRGVIDLVVFSKAFDVFGNLSFSAISLEFPAAPADQLTLPSLVTIRTTTTVANNASGSSPSPTRCGFWDQEVITVALTYRQIPNETFFLDLVVTLQSNHTDSVISMRGAFTQRPCLQMVASKASHDVALLANQLVPQELMFTLTPQASFVLVRGEAFLPSASNISSSIPFARLVNDGLGVHVQPLSIAVVQDLLLVVLNHPTMLLEPTSGNFSMTLIDATTSTDLLVAATTMVNVTIDGTSAIQGIRGLLTPTAAKHNVMWSTSDEPPTAELEVLLPATSVIPEHMRDGWVCQFEAGAGSPHAAVVAQTTAARRPASAHGGFFVHCPVPRTDEWSAARPPWTSGRPPFVAVVRMINRDNRTKASTADAWTFSTAHTLWVLPVPAERLRLRVQHAVYVDPVAAGASSVVVHQPQWRDASRGSNISAVLLEINTSSASTVSLYTSVPPQQQPPQRCVFVAAPVAHNASVNATVLMVPVGRLVQEEQGRRFKFPTIHLVVTLLADDMQEDDGEVPLPVTDRSLSTRVSLHQIGGANAMTAINATSLVSADPTGMSVTFLDNNDVSSLHNGTHTNRSQDDDAFHRAMLSVTCGGGEFLLRYRILVDWTASNNASNALLLGGAPLTVDVHLNCSDPTCDRTDTGRNEGVALLEELEPETVNISLAALHTPRWFVLGCMQDVFPVTSMCRGRERVQLYLVSYSEWNAWYLHTRLPNNGGSALSSNDISVEVLFLQVGGSSSSLLSLPCIDPSVAVADPYIHTSLAGTDSLVIACTLPEIAGAATDVVVRISNISGQSPPIDLPGALSFPGEDAIHCLYHNEQECNGRGRCDKSSFFPSVVCACANDGVSGRWSGQACDDCAPGFFGATCTERCPGEFCITCSGHGWCEDGTVGSGRCTCYASSIYGFWAEDDCSDCADNVYGAECTLRCPVDLETGLTCAGHGVCDDGVVGVGVCVCNEGFTSPTCSACQPGYFSRNCAACPSTLLGGTPCDGVGTCDDGKNGTGICTCNVGFTGPACNVSCGVAFNTTCGWGTCIGPHQCQCDSGNIIMLTDDVEDQTNLNSTTTTMTIRSAAAGACATCASGWWGPRCSQPCSCVFGVCNPVNGYCACNAGYWGSSCDAPCPGGATNPCNLHGTCDETNGTCRCFADPVRGYYDGPSCAVCDALYNSPACTVACPYDPETRLPCSGRGRCFNGSCVGSCLNNAYWGSACQYECPGGATNPCYMRGTCDETSGVCTCAYGFYGVMCELVCPPGSMHSATCNGHGTCTSTGSCDCNVNVTTGFWGGYACDVCASFYSGPNCTAICNPNGGRVIGKTCVCATGFVGPQCFLVCPRDADGAICSGRGECIDGGKGAASCLCFADYYGPTCAQYCTVENCLATTTLFRAQCNASNGACVCRDNSLGHWTGQNCDACVSGYWTAECNALCPCSGNGGCNQFVPSCQCYSGFGAGFWAGGACSVCQDGFIGTNCNIRNLEMSLGAQASHPVNNTIAFAAVDKSGGVICSDPVHNVMLMGVNPLVSFVSPSPWAMELTAMRAFALSSSAVRCAVYNATHIEVMLSPTDENNSLNVSGIQHVYIERELLRAPATASRVVGGRRSAALSILPHKKSKYQSTDNNITVSRRGYSALDTTTVSSSSVVVIPTTVLVAVDSATGCYVLANVSSNVTSTVRIECPSPPTAASSSQLFFFPEVYQIELPHNVHWVGFVDDFYLVVVSWSAETARGTIWGLTVFRTWGNASSRVRWNITSEGGVGNLEECEARGGCGTAYPCFPIHLPEVAPPPSFPSVGDPAAIIALLEENEAQLQLMCAALVNADGSRNALVLFSLHLEAMQLSSPSMVVNDVFLVTAVAVDRLYHQALVAFDGATTGGLVRVELSALPYSLSSLFSLDRYSGGRARVARMVIDPATRTLWMSVATAESVRAVAVNLFSIASVEPKIIDQLGGVVVTLKGVGFTADPLPRCDFYSNIYLSTPSSASTSAVFVDTETLLCPAPEVYIGTLDPVCTTLQLNIWYGGRATRTLLVGTSRPLSATVDEATTEQSGGASAASHFFPATITIVGFGFIATADQASCRLEEHDGSHILVFRATAVNSSIALCYMPMYTPLSHPGSVIRYAHDSFVYSLSSAPFVVVGAYHSIRASLWLVNSTLHLVAGILTPLPITVVHTIDVNGNELNRYDNESQRDIRCSSMHPDVLSDVNAPQPAFASGSQTQQFIEQHVGWTLFRDVTLARPSAGEFPVFFFPLFDRQTVSTITFLVLAGAPSSVQLVPGTATSSWVGGVMTFSTIPSFSLVVVDVVANVIRDATVIPDSMSVGYTNRVPAATGSSSRLEPENWETFLDAASCTYTFAALSVRSSFDRRIVLHFSTANVSITPLDVVLAQQLCDDGFYGKEDGFTCMACPPHASCDGSTAIVADVGYWRGDVVSSFLYPCGSTSSCRTSTECAVGYEGPLCTSCAPGYGRTFSTCDLCVSSSPMPYVVVVVIVLGMVAVVYALSLRSIAFTAYADVKARLIDTSAKRTAFMIVVKVGVSHLQTLSLLPLKLLTVSWIGNTLSSSGSWTVISPSFLNIACVVGRRAIHEMNASIVLTGTTIAGCLLVAIGMALLADFRFRDEARRRIVQYRAQRTKMAQASPLLFRAADEALVHANFAFTRHRDAVIRNHRALVEEEYPGDVDFSSAASPRSLHNAGGGAKQPHSSAGGGEWWLDMDMGDDVMDMVPLDILVADTAPESDSHLALPSSHIVRPSVISRVINIMLVAIVVTTFLVYPTVVQAAVRVIQCESLRMNDHSTISVVSYDPAVTCGGNSGHDTSVYEAQRSAAYVVLVACGVCIPILCPCVIIVAAIVTCEGSLDRAKQLFFFVTGGYRVWYWESIVLARKAAVVVAVGFIADSNVSSMASMWVLGVALALNVALRPWESPALGNLEAASLGTLSCTSILLAALAANRDPSPALVMLIVVCVAAVNVWMAVLFVKTFIVTFTGEVLVGSELDETIKRQGAAIARLRSERHALLTEHRDVHRRSMRLHSFVEMETVLAIRRQKKRAEEVRRKEADDVREREALRISAQEEDAVRSFAVTSGEFTANDMFVIPTTRRSERYNSQSNGGADENVIQRPASSSSSTAVVEVSIHPDQVPQYWANFVASDIGDGSPPAHWWEEEEEKLMIAAAGGGAPDNDAADGDHQSSVPWRACQQQQRRDAIVVTDLEVPTAQDNRAGPHKAANDGGRCSPSGLKTSVEGQGKQMSSASTSARQTPHARSLGTSIPSSASSKRVAPIIHDVSEPPPALSVTVVPMPPTPPNTASGLDDPLLENFMNVPQEFVLSDSTSTSSGQEEEEERSEGNSTSAKRVSPLTPATGGAARTRRQRRRRIQRKSSTSQFGGTNSLTTPRQLQLLFDASIHSEICVDNISFGECEDTLSIRDMDGEAAQHKSDESTIPSLEELPVTANELAQAGPTAEQREIEERQRIAEERRQRRQQEVEAFRRRVASFVVEDRAYLTMDEAFIALVSTYGAMPREILAVEEDIATATTPGSSLRWQLKDRMASLLEEVYRAELDLMRSLLISVQGGDGARAIRAVASWRSLSKGNAGSSLMQLIHNRSTGAEGGAVAAEVEPTEEEGDRCLRPAGTATLHEHYVLPGAVLHHATRPGSRESSAWREPSSFANVSVDYDDLPDDNAVLHCAVMQHELAFGQGGEMEMVEADALPSAAECAPRRGDGGGEQLPDVGIIAHSTSLFDGDWGFDEIHHPDDVPRRQLPNHSSLRTPEQPFADEDADIDVPLEWTL